jgi:hypothetical protein
MAVPETPFGLTMHGKNPHPFSGSVFSATSHPGENNQRRIELEQRVRFKQARQVHRPGAGTPPGFPNREIKHYYDYCTSVDGGGHAGPRRPGSEIFALIPSWELRLRVRYWRERLL